MTEYAPARIRGRVASMLPMCWPMGYFTAAGAALALVPHVSWRWLFAIGVLPAILAFIIRRKVPESPRWLAAHGRHEEALVSLKAWNALPADLKAIVAHACAVEANYALSEMERLNAAALDALVKQHNVKLTAFPNDLVTAARQQADDVLGELARRDAISAKVHASYAAFRAQTAPWSRVSIEAVLTARGA